MGLTEWEIGQELIAAQDALFEAAEDMDKSHPAYLLLNKLALEIGDYFNKHHRETHVFGLASNEPTPTEKGGEG